MSYKQNLHTHCTFCDGKDSPKEMIETAIEKGFDSIGFSSHTPMFYSPTFAIPPEKTKDYTREIYDLKTEYADKIKIFCGWEYDMYSDIDLEPYDYIIGSLHYFKIGDEYIGFDRSKEAVKEVIDKYFGGNGMIYAKRYYKDVACLPDYGKFDIIGHFDLIAKHAENANFFDTDSKEYLSCAKEAIVALKGKIPFFEVNTGAIARGYRTSPYPMKNLIEEFKVQGFGVVITSDCHDRRMLDCSFLEAAELLKACGFKEKYILTENGFEATEI